MRRLPWVKRLAADYAYAFSGLAPFFSGNPADAAAWAAAIAPNAGASSTPSGTGAGHPRATAASRRARPGAGRGRAPRRCADRCRAHRPAGGSVRRSGLHAAQIHHRAQARRTGVARARRAGGRRVLDRGRRPRLGRGAIVHGAGRGTGVPDGRPAAAAAGQSGAGRDDRARRSDRGGPRRARTDAAGHRVPRLAPRRPARGLQAGHRYGRGIRAMDGAGARRTRADCVRRLGPADEAARQPACSRASCQRPATRRWPPRKPAPICRSAATTRRSRRRTAARRSFILARRGGRSVSRTASWWSKRPRYAPAALAQEAAERPAGFSPNVLLRPIVQDALFPTLCYVAGPSELAYLGQLRGVYEHFGVPMPLMYPRATATLVDSAASRFLTKYKLPLEALAASGRRRRSTNCSSPRFPPKSTKPSPRPATRSRNR